MGKYDLASTPFPPLSDPLGYVHGGTGRLKVTRNLVLPGSVTDDFNAPLEQQWSPNVEVTVMSFEISTRDTPNWFGVAFRTGLTKYGAINIFCHPAPTKNMQEASYQSRGGDWPRLFRYAELLGSQIAVAGSNQIVLVPFFNPGSYGTSGLFGANWQEIVAQIIDAVRNEVQRVSAEQSVSFLSDVVLSDFSYGRHLMYNLRRQATGLEGYLREVWDFDGVGLEPPYTTAKVKGILYNQQPVRDFRAFHVPGPRWVKFHGNRVPDTHTVHGDIPAMLALHAATKSSVGK